MNADIEKSLTDKSLQYLDQIMVAPLKEVGGIIADQVRFWRYKNQVKILEKVKEIHNKYNISPKKIPVKTVACLMEYSSLEDDESLQKMWANLLANATNSMNKKKGHLAFACVLKELSYDDAILLKFMWEKDQESAKKNGLQYKFDYEFLKLMSKENKLPYDIEKNHLIIDNLVRLNLIRLITPNPRIDSFSGAKYVEFITMTVMGTKLMEECNLPQLV